VFMFWAEMAMLWSKTVYTESEKEHQAELVLRNRCQRCSWGRNSWFFFPPIHAVGNYHTKPIIVEVLLLLPFLQPVLSFSISQHRHFRRWEAVRVYETSQTTTRR
jgi:hypothetical protein